MAEPLLLRAGAIRAGAAAIALTGGLLAIALAEVLPRWLGVTPLVTGRARYVRSAVVLGVATAFGLATGGTLAAGDTEALAWVRLAFAAVFAASLVAAAAIDVEHMLLPDALTLGAAALAVATAPLRFSGGVASLVPSVVGGGLGFAVVVVPELLYRALRRRSGVGLGDAKLLVFVGAWLGPVAVLVALFLGSVLSIACAALLRALGASYRVPESVRREIEELRARADAGDADADAELRDDPMAAAVGDGVLATRLPFGPFLAAGALAAATFPRAAERAMSWLLGGSLLGGSWGSGG